MAASHRQTRLRTVPTSIGQSRIGNHESATFLPTGAASALVFRICRTRQQRRTRQATRIGEIRRYLSPKVPWYPLLGYLGIIPWYPLLLCGSTCLRKRCATPLGPAPRPEQLARSVLSLSPACAQLAGALESAAKPDNCAAMGRMHSKGCVLQ